MATVLQVDGVKEVEEEAHSLEMTTEDMATVIALEAAAKEAGALSGEIIYDTILHLI